MTIQKPNREEKAYIVWRFVLELHKDPLFETIQRPLNKVLGWIQDSELFPYLETISINEFAKLSKDVMLFEPEEVALLLKGIKGKVDENIRAKLKEVIANAEKNKKR